MTKTLEQIASDVRAAYSQGATAGMGILGSLAADKIEIVHVPVHPRDGIWDGSAWELVGPGATVGPVPTSTLTFQLVEPNVGVAYSGLTATWSIVPVTATPTVDTEHGWNSTTRQYMPNKAGIYLFEVMVIAWAQAGYNMGFTLARNDTGTITNSVDMVASWLGGGGASEVFYATASGTRRMNGTTDFVRLFGLAAGGTANSYIAPGQSPILKATLLP